jgi:hypothetical protein
MRTQSTCSKPKFDTKTLVAFLMLSMISLNIMTLGFAVGPETYFGHTFDEEYWSIDFDFYNSRVKSDYTPGMYADSYAPPQERRYQYGEINGFISYIQVANSRILFIASKNHSMNTRDPDVGGFLPYQTFIQSYPGPSGDYFIVQNTFLGLMAHWQDLNDTSSFQNSTEYFFGSTINSNALRNTLNSSLSQKMGYPALTETRTAITSNPIVKKEIQQNGMNITEYRFGINYSNVYLFWHSIRAQNGLNQTLTESEILTEILGFSRIEYLNFTYIVQEKKISSKASEIYTSTEYDIGATIDLWIKNDNATFTASHNGTFVNMGFGRSLSRYNSSTSIQSRLTYNNTKEMALTIANYVRAISIATNNLNNNGQAKLRYVDEQSNQLSREQDRPVQKININIDSENNLYKIDFASKPNYTVDGTEFPANFLTVSGSSIINPDIRSADNMIIQFIQPYLRASVENHYAKRRIAARDSRLNVDIQSIDNYYYYISFPKWNGRAINQDPVFIAFPSPFDLEPGFAAVIMVGLIFGFCAIPYILVKKYKR